MLLHCHHYTSYPSPNPKIHGSTQNESAFPLFKKAADLKFGATRSDPPSSMAGVEGFWYQEPTFCFRLSSQLELLGSAVQVRKSRVISLEVTGRQAPRRREWRAAKRSKFEKVSLPLNATLPQLKCTLVNQCFRPSDEMLQRLLPFGLGFRRRDLTGRLQIRRFPLLEILPDGLHYTWNRLRALCRSQDLPKAAWSGLQQSSPNPSTLPHRRRKSEKEGISDFPFTQHG
jgi:hypothetical protein